MPQDVPLAFFSYSREDSEFALKLAADLKASGANVWIDRLDIKPGQWWDKSVEEALNQCPRMLVILSPASVNSKNVLDEVSFAMEEQKTVLPVLYQECHIPFRLRRVQYVDFTKDYNQALQRLLDALAARPVPTTDVIQAAMVKEALAAEKARQEREASQPPEKPQPEERSASALPPNTLMRKKNGNALQPSKPALMTIKRRLQPRRPAYRSWSAEPRKRSLSKQKPNARPSPPSRLACNRSGSVLPRSRPAWRRNGSRPQPIRRACCNLSRSAEPLRRRRDWKKSASRPLPRKLVANRKNATERPPLKSPESKPSSASVPPPSKPERNARRANGAKPKRNSDWLPHLPS